MNGRTTDENGIVAHTDRWLQNMANLSAFTAHRRPLQDEETGLPYYIEGIHAEIGGVDNAGLAPGTQPETTGGIG